MVPSMLGGGDCRLTSTIVNGSLQVIGNITTEYNIKGTGYGNNNGDIIIHPQLGNEINFGGINTSDSIFFGYRASDSRPIPANFIFGGSTGTAKITCGNIVCADVTTTRLMNTTAELEVRGLLRAYRATNNSTLAAIVMDKQGAGSYGIGPDGTAMRIRYGSASIVDGTWLDYSIEHFFHGTVIVSGKGTFNSGISLNNSGATGGISYYTSSCTATWKTYMSSGSAPGSNSSPAYGDVNSWALRNVIEGVMDMGLHGKLVLMIVLVLQFL